MAFEEFPIRHYIIGIDQQGNKFRVYAQSDGTSSATADGLSIDFKDKFSAVSDLKIIEYGYTSISRETDITPPLGVAGEQKALITALLETTSPPNPGQDRTGKIVIPAPKNDLFLAPSGDGNNIVDVNNAALLDYLDLWTSGLALPGFTVSDFQHILDPNTAGNVKGKRVTARSKRG